MLLRCRQGRLEEAQGQLGAIGSRHSRCSGERLRAAATLQAQRVVLGLQGQQALPLLKKERVGVAKRLRNCGKVDLG